MKLAVKTRGDGSQDVKFETESDREASDLAVAVKAAMRRGALSTLGVAAELEKLGYGVLLPAGEGGTDDAKL